MKRDITIALVLAAIGLGPLLGHSPAQAQTAKPSMELSRPAQLSDWSAQRRGDRPPTRLRVYPRYAPDSYGVYPRYFPGRNAVRDCTATYVEEYRPSGTVITPRMNCFWRRG
jgi:hypothetical protein